MHQSRKEGQKSLLIGLISFSLVGSPSLYHAAIFIVTKPQCSRHKQGGQNASGDEGGGGGGEEEEELGERKNFPPFPSVFCIP